jgi:hypothetical protein
LYLLLRRETQAAQSWESRVDFVDTGVQELLRCRKAKLVFWETANDTDKDGGWCCRIPVHNKKMNDDPALQERPVPQA